MSCSWSFKENMGWQYLYQRSGGHLKKEVLVWRRCTIYQSYCRCSTGLANYSIALSHEHSVEKRANFAAHMGTYEANRLVFVNESPIDRRTTYRGYAWAIRGWKATRKAFFCRGKRWVKSIDQYNWNSPIVIQDTLYYLHYLSKSLRRGCPPLRHPWRFFRHSQLLYIHQEYPWPYATFSAPNSVIVIDNCHIHKHPDIQNLIESQ